jgi:hypothetical protein
MISRPRFGPVYAACVMRGLGEQVVEALAAGTGETVCDLLADSGVLTAALLRRGASVLAADSADPPPGATAVRCDGERVALGTASCAATGSLLTLGFGNPSALLAEARRVTLEPHRVALLVWNSELPPVFEAALRDALRAAGHDSTFLRGLLPELSGGLRAGALSVADVCRFDGMNQLWFALVEDRHLRDELTGLSGEAQRAVRVRLGEAMAGYAAPDGTLRVPVSALLLR